MTEAGLGAGDSLNPKVWRGVKLKEFAIYHGEPPCAAGETMFPAYHHGDYPGQTENLELRSNGSLVVSWDDRSVELQTKIREDFPMRDADAMIIINSMGRPLSFNQPNRHCISVTIIECLPTVS